jgi:hypothetical protein
MRTSKWWVKQFIIDDKILLRKIDRDNKNLLSFSFLPTSMLKSVASYCKIRRVYNISSCVLSHPIVTETSVFFLTKVTFSPVQWLMYICKSLSQINFLSSLKSSVKHNLSQTSDRAAICGNLNIEPVLSSQQIIRSICDKPSGTEMGYSPSTFFSLCYLPFKQSFTLSKPHLRDET